jgi:FkbM family methyltransferase
MAVDLTKKWLRDLLTPLSYLRYLLWRLSRSSKEIIVKLAKSKKIIIRPLPTNDLATAYEIFLDEAYQQPIEVPDISPELIVDIGANVGYSIIYFIQKYPNARLIAFEPLPIHLEIINKHLEVNQISNRVEVLEMAVSNTDSNMFIINKGCESVVIENFENDCLPIKVCDFFAFVGINKIDLLKMDIEGGEYSILNDERFEAINIRNIVLEWHNTESVINGHQWCSNRLTALGYKVVNGKLRYQNAGILWAWK